MGATNVDSGPGAPRVRRLVEAEIGAGLAHELAALLQECFGEYPDRSYFKLPPHQRYVAGEDGAVVAQMGVEYRVMRVGALVVRTLGVVDLCVRPGHRSRGLAGTLLAEVTDYAGSCEVDFVVLFADDDRLYARNGWVRVDPACTWLKIHEHESLGLANAERPHAMMVKAVGDRSWPDGDVDLLGHLF
jgi:GNAT superfamily N-acetyltransferase